MPDLDFFLARRARRGFLDSETFLILVGSSCTLMVARACDISSCGREGGEGKGDMGYIYLQAKREMHATCMQGRVVELSVSILTSNFNCIH